MTHRTLVLAGGLVPPRQQIILPDEVVEVECFGYKGTNNFETTK